MLLASVSSHTPVKVLICDNLSLTLFLTVSCAEKVASVVSDFLSAVEELDNHWTCIAALTAAASLHVTLKDEKKAQNGGK